MGNTHKVIGEQNNLQTLPRSAQAARAWLIDRALPFWAENTVDSAGGFCEELSRYAKPNWQSIRRLRVQARQIYAYALAQEHGWYAGLPVAERTLNFMLSKGFMPDGSPGFISLLNADCAVEDARRDLYDHAFYLLALAWYARVSGRQIPLALADSLLDFLDRNLGAENGGFLEGLPHGDPRNALRRQNPHMHLFEAFMALYDVGGDKKYLRRADEIFGLFKEHFFDADTHTITEYFRPDWRPAKGRQGQSVEPGHMAEWVWLLGQYQARSGVNTRSWADSLYQKLCSYDTLLLPDEMNKTGASVRTTRRLWVQTEMVKAHLAQAEMGEADSFQLAAVGINMITDKYLRPDGSWVDVLGENGLPTLGSVPTSTFYHISCMVSEACRVSRLEEVVKPKVHLRG